MSRCAPSWMCALEQAGAYDAPSNDYSPHQLLHLNENLFVDENDQAVLQVVLANLEASALSHYPKDGAEGLRRCLCDLCGVTPEEVLIAPGCASLLQHLLQLLVRHGTEVAMVRPSWSYYHHLVRQHRGIVLEVPLRRRPGSFCFDAKGFDACLTRHRPRLAILTSPNNPTGESVPLEALSRLVADHPETLFLVDQTYDGFVTGAAAPPLPLIRAAANVVLLRSMSKFYALAGVRVGYALGHQVSMKILATGLPPFGISLVDQRLCVARLRDPAFAARVAKRCEASKQQLVQRLGSTPELRCYASDANFVLVRTPPRRASWLAARLHAAGYVVAPKDIDGQDRHLRITLAAPELMKRVADLLCALVAEPDNTPLVTERRDHEVGHDYQKAPRRARRAPRLGVARTRSQSRR